MKRNFTDENSDLKRLSVVKKELGYYMSLTRSNPGRD